MRFVLLPALDCFNSPILEAYFYAYVSINFNFIYFELFVHYRFIFVFCKMSSNKCAMALIELCNCRRRWDESKQKKYCQVNFRAAKVIEKFAEQRRQKKKTWFKCFSWLFFANMKFLKIERYVICVCEDEWKWKEKKKTSSSFKVHHHHHYRDYMHLRTAQKRRRRKSELNLANVFDHIWIFP